MCQPLFRQIPELAQRPVNPALSPYPFLALPIGFYFTGCDRFFERCAPMRANALRLLGAPAAADAFVRKSAVPLSLILMRMHAGWEFPDVVRVDRDGGRSPGAGRTGRTTDG
jgi:hypothetical protein